MHYSVSVYLSNFYLRETYESLWARVPRRVFLSSRCSYFSKFSSAPQGVSNLSHQCSRSLSSSQSPLSPLSLTVAGIRRYSWTVSPPLSSNVILSCCHEAFGASPLWLGCLKYWLKCPRPLEQPSLESGYVTETQKSTKSQRGRNRGNIKREQGRAGREGGSEKDMDKGGWDWEWGKCQIWREEGIIWLFGSSFKKKKQTVCHRSNRRK